MAYEITISVKKALNKCLWLSFPANIAKLFFSELDAASRAIAFAVRVVAQLSRPLSDMACDFTISMETVLEKDFWLSLHAVIRIGANNVIGIEIDSPSAAFVNYEIV
jgi:hypothetical protein